MPQFDFANVTWPQLAWLFIIFAILYFGIVRMTLPKLAKTIDAREGQIAGDLATAESAKGEADRIAATYAESIDEAHKSARGTVAAAKAKAAANVEAALAKSNAAIAERAAAADAALAKARAKAMGEVEAVAADAAADIVERLTGVRPDAKMVAGAAKSAVAA